MNQESLKIWMDHIKAWSEYVVFGNTIQVYVLSLVMFMVVMTALRVMKMIVIKRLQNMAAKTATDIDDFVVGLFRHIGAGVYLLMGVYIASRSLVLAGSIDRVLNILFVGVLTFKAVQVLQDVVVFFLDKWMGRTETNDPTARVATKNLGIIVKVVLWIGGVLFLLDNLGIDVTAAVAGLGITGIAVALAAQTLLKDTFAAFCIFIDKPFRVGEFIIVGDLMGTVEYVGFKTTRIRSLGGEQLIFPNSDLTENRVRNFKRMEQRRIVFKFGVIYQTPVEKVKLIPDIVRRIVAENSNARLDRVHFMSYGDFALIYEVVFFVLKPDFQTYGDVQQYINIRLMEEFQKHKIEFAYPTQQIYVTSVTPPVNPPLK